MLARGRNAGRRKHWTRMVKCSYRECLTNTKESDKNMFPFPKPCSAFVHSLIDPVKHEHSVSDCERCEKCLRWIELCGNDGIKNMEDVSARTYICIKHFHDGMGPTDIYPDPLPAYSLLPDSRKAQRVERVPSQFVEAIPFVEAVYDEDAVMDRIQKAIQLDQSAQNSSITRNSAVQNFSTTQNSSMLGSSTQDSLTPDYSVHSYSMDNSSMQHCSMQLGSALVLLEKERVKNATLARKLEHCQALSKRRLKKIRDLKAAAKEAKKKARAGKATRS